MLYSFFLGNHPKERIQHSEHGESLKSKVNMCCVATTRTVDTQQTCGGCRSYRTVGSNVGLGGVTGVFSELTGN